MNATGEKRITQLRGCLEPSRPTSSAEGGYGHPFDENLTRKEVVQLQMYLLWPNIDMLTVVKGAAGSGGE